MTLGPTEPSITGSFQLLPVWSSVRVNVFGEVAATAAGAFLFMLEALFFL
jgi:hypothetical protein